MRHPPGRMDVIAMLPEMESAPVATQEELLALMAVRHLYGRDCGFVDMSLLASSLLRETALIWTLDKRLELLALELNRAYRPKIHS